MNILDEFRDGFVARRIPDVSVGAAPVLSLAERTRRTMWWLFGIMVALAALNPLIAHLLGTMTGGSDLMSIGRNVLVWPAAFVQSGLFAVVAVAVIVLATMTRGFGCASPAAARATTAIGVVGGVAALPTVTVVAVAIALMLLASLVVVGLVWLIFAAVSS